MATLKPKIWYFLKIDPNTVETVYKVTGYKVNPDLR